MKTNVRSNVEEVKRGMTRIVKMVIDCVSIGKFNIANIFDDIQQQLRQFITTTHRQLGWCRV